MKRIFTSLLFGLLVSLSLPVMAQDVDESYMFIDENEDFIDNNATIVRNVVSTDIDGNEVIYSGLSVVNVSGDPGDYIKMTYVVETIDNGSFQLCFPSTCNYAYEEGAYETAASPLMADVQDLMCEWFPTDDGECVVTMSIEVLTKQGLFPPTYVHKAYGPTVTVRFVKGGTPDPKPIPGDVNGDGEVNINDVNLVIDYILVTQEDEARADVNGDGEVNISDANMIIDLILSGN